MDNMNGLDPKYLALIQAGLGILAGNNGRQSAGAAIGQGLLGGVGAYQSGLQNQQMMAMRQNQYDQQNKMYAQNQDEYNRKLKEEQTQKAAKARLLRGQDGYMQVNDGSSYEQDLVDSGYGDMMFKQQFNKNADPYFTPIPTDKGMARFNNRTGGLELITLPNGQTVVKSSDSPDVRGSVKAAESLAAAQYKPNTDIDGVVSTDAQVAQQSLGREGGIKVPTKAEQKTAEFKAESNAKKDQSMSGIGSIIDEARGVLTGAVKPTSSKAGVVIDALGAAIGQSPEGAAQADQLKAIGGALVAKMPRMEGPQSNFDVQNYERMAGDVGNPTLPIERRLEALATVEKLWRKYDKSEGNIMPRNETINAKPAPKSVLKGQVYKGHKFLGGDPSNPANWTKQ
jgi:hypothetical protein